MAKLFLVDGMSHIYRAYFAIKGLTNREGLSTNAVYGFTAMIRKLIKDESPDYLGVALDLFGPTVRHEQYEDYKATREKMPDDLVEQIPYVRLVCEALRVPILTFEKYEADDVIGTLSRQAYEEGIEVVIVTVDKDMFQLVNERISILDTRAMSLLGPEEVFAKWGVRPDQIVDTLALVGDASDNIPGAPGIGEKGARSLIGEYDTLENLLAHRDEISRKSYRSSLQENEDLIKKSQELVTIHQHLPLKLDLDDLRLVEPDKDLLRSLFTELNFTTFLREIQPEEEIKVRVKDFKDIGDLESLAEELASGPVAISCWIDEVESGLMELSGLAISVSGRSWFLARDFIREQSHPLAKLFSAPGIEWVFHDFKRFLMVSRRLGWKVSGSVRDTMLAAYLLDPNKNDFSLEKVCIEQLGIKLGSEKHSLLGGDRPGDLAERAEAVLRLNDNMLPQLRESELEDLFEKIEMPLVEVLSDMEAVGVKVDTDLLVQMSGELSQEIDRLTERIYGIAGEEFNLNSPKQMSYILFEKLNLPLKKKKGKAGHYSTGVEVLEELSTSYEIAQLILDYRELAKLQSTYLDALPKLVNSSTGRIHTSYNQMVAATGRLSSSNPNLQNIPIRSELGRKVRRAFIAEDGYRILAADYSQVELRVMAHLSEDPVLMDAFTRGEDIHERTAREVFGEGSEEDSREYRRRAKVINFGIMYGLSAFGLAKSLKIGRPEAQQFIDDYFDRYDGVRRWIENVLENATQTGRVKTLFGRIRQVPEINSRNRNLREFARRTAVNAPIQGTAADLIKMAMVSIHRRIGDEGLKSKVILQVHDELVCEVSLDEVEVMKRLVREEMEGVAQLKVPLKVELSVGSSWYEAK